jgi:hypothetical protein
MGEECHRHCRDTTRIITGNSCLHCVGPYPRSNYTPHAPLHSQHARAPAFSTCCAWSPPTPHAPQTPLTSKTHPSHQPSAHEAHQILVSPPHGLTAQPTNSLHHKLIAAKQKQRRSRNTPYTTNSLKGGGHRERKAVPYT